MESSKLFMLWSVKKAFERFPKKRFKIFLAKVRPFLTEKIRNRLQFHGSCRQNLHRSLGKTILPSDYGGDQVGLEQHHYITECLLQVGDEDDQEELIEALTKLSDFCSLLQQLFA